MRFLLVAFLLSLVACNVPALDGQPGEQGEPGRQGPRGPAGADALRTDVYVVLATADDPESLLAVAACEEGDRLLSGSCTWGKTMWTVQPWRAEPLTEEGEPYAFACEGEPNNVRGEAPTVLAYAVCEGEGQ
jgi:hypothetical protein